MPEPDEAPLVAVLLPATTAAPAVRAVWEEGAAVAVLDRRAPAHALSATLERLRPTHVLDGDGRRARPGGAPVPCDVVAVVLTSGTTGEPKAVELTAAGREAIGTGFAGPLSLGPDDRWLVCLPLHHVAGLAILGRAMTAGFETVVHDGFDPDAVMASPAREGATVVSLVPTALGRLLDAGTPLERYRYLVVGGAATPPALRARAGRARAPVVDTYGLSETWGGCALDGHPVAGTEVRVGRVGELELRGPVLMRGYRGDPAATAAAFTDDGWLRTGDTGTRDAGRVGVTGRVREVIITGGVNVSPAAVEHVLADHPDLADVCVAGRPDDEWGERVVAFVVPRPGRAVPGAGELRRFAAGRLSPAQQPRSVVPVAAVPRTHGGKVLRRLLPRAP